MNYYTTGRIHERSAITEGVSQQGNTWQRMTLVIEVPVGQYSKKMAFQVSTNNIASVMEFKDGDKVEVTWDIASREWTNKEGVRSWFTSAELRGIKAASDIPAVPSMPMPGPGEPQDDDLPFGNE